MSLEISEGDDGGFDLELSPPTKIRDIERLMDDLSLAVGAEFIDLKRQGKVLHLKPYFSMKDIFPLQDYKNEINKSSPEICLGLNTKEYITYNPTKDYHMLIAGCSGFGKSTLIKSIIEQFLWKDNVDVDVIDPKYVDFKEINNRANKNFSLYNNIVDIMTILKYHNKRIDRIFSSGEVPENPTVLIVDEFADLMTSEHSKVLMADLLRIVQKSRAANMFCILATQRPSAKIIGGTIKASVQTRVALKTTSKLDSRIILDTTGAEKITSKGECIILSQNYNLKRFKSFTV